MKKAKSKKKKPSISRLKKKLDAVFSEWVRRSQDCCFTCGKVEHWKDAQAGHFISRTFTCVRWNDMNVNRQCVSCNVFKHGNMVEYWLAMEKKYGREIIDWLNDIKRKPFKLHTSWLEEQIEFYRLKILEMSSN